MGTELNPNHFLLRFGHEKQYSVTCAAFFFFDKSKSSIQKQQQYSKRGYLPVLKFGFGHGADFWPKHFDFSEGKREKPELMRMPERQ